MRQSRGVKATYGCGNRLIQLRKHLGYAPGDMARKLDMQRPGYFKNERGETFPSLKTLDILQRDWGVSMDWLLFGKGPMFFKEAPKSVRALTAAPEIQELLTHMAEDPKLKHGVMLYFLEQKKKSD